MRTVPLGDLCHISIGRTPSRANSDYWGGPHAWATISDMTGTALSTTKESVTDLAVQEARLQPVAPGTLLFSFKLTIGKMAIASTELYTNEAIAALVPRSPTLDPMYLRYALASIDAGAGASTAVKGRTLNSATLSMLPVPVAPPDEQRRIALELSDQLVGVDVMRDRTIARVMSAKALRTALIDEPFVALAARSEGRSIASVARVQTGYAFRSDWFRESGVRLLRNANVGHRRSIGLTRRVSTRAWSRNSRPSGCARATSCYRSIGRLSRPA